MVKSNHNQWRIQDFPKLDDNRKGVSANLIFWLIAYQNCKEMKKLGHRAHTPSARLHVSITTIASFLVILVDLVDSVKISRSERIPHAGSYWLLL